MLIETQDAALLHGIMQQAFAEYRHDASPSSALGESTDSIKLELHNGMRAFVWQHQQQTVAMVKTQWRHDVLYFARLAVLPSARGQGHAKHMLMALAQLALAHGYTAMECKVRAEVSRNVALYQGLGFVCAASETVHKENGTAVPTLTMRKALFESMHNPF